MVLELVQDRPQLHQRLRPRQTLLTTVEREARELKASDEDCKKLQRLWGGSESQIAGEVLETGFGIRRIGADGSVGCQCPVVPLSA